MESLAILRVRGNFITCRFFIPLQIPGGTGRRFVVNDGSKGKPNNFRSKHSGKFFNNIFISILHSLMGRKKLYTPETLEIGAKMELLGKAKKFKDQYLYTFNNRGAEKYRSILEGKKVFIERVA